MIKPSSRRSDLERTGLYAAPAVAPHDSLASYLSHRSRTWRADTRDHSPHGPRSLSSVAASRLPETLAETQFDLGKGCDKVFASAWLTENQVVVGTKCNTLMLVNVNSGKVIELPYQSIVRGARMAGSASPSAIRRSRQASAANMDPVMLNPSAPLTTAANTAAGDASTAPGPPCVGIHAIAINPSRTRLAVGSGKPFEIVVYSLPSLEPIALLTGHADLVFAAAWADDDVLLTGSRDGHVGAFSLRALNDGAADSLNVPYATTPVGDLPVLKPVAMRSEHAGHKVRDISLNPLSQQLCSLGTDGTVRVWDVSRMHVVARSTLAHAHEAVCLGMDAERGVLSVGSQSHVSLLDVRTDAYSPPPPRARFGNQGAGRVIHSALSLDEGWGVRSLAHNQHTVVVGGGTGKLSFYDIRGQKYLPCGATGDWAAAGFGDGSDGSGVSVVQEYLQASVPSGFDMRSRNPTYPIGICSALYTIQFNADKTRLFTAGGPLQLGAKGAYAALW